MLLVANIMQWPIDVNQGYTGQHHSSIMQKLKSLFISNHNDVIHFIVGDR